MTPELLLGLASLEDAHDIFELVYSHPDPFLRQASLDQIQNWVNNGACWIIRDLKQGKIVGACNIKVPETDRCHPPEPAEFGGIFLHPDYRRLGISDALATLALSSYYWDTDPDSLSPIPLISHVHVDNQKPRSLLDRLGFLHVKTIKVPDDAPGFEHMPRDEHGQLFGDEFELPPERRVRLFRDMAELLSTGMVGEIPVQIAAALEMNPVELHRLASFLEGQ